MTTTSRKPKVADADEAIDDVVDEVDEVTDADEVDEYDEGDDEQPAIERRLGLGLLIGGIIGLLAASVLLIERILLAENPAYVPSCSLNPVLSCGSVMESAQAALFGFPNPLIGVAAFPFVIATGAAILAGARFARWYWIGLQIGVTAGMAMVSWLIFQSIYRIGALCPYCMVVWTVVIPTFLYVTLRNAREGVFGAGVRDSRATAALSRWHAPVLVLAFLIVATMILIQFWSFWSRI